MKVTTETVCGEKKQVENKKKKSGGRREHFWRKRKACGLDHKAKLSLEAGDGFNSFFKYIFLSSTKPAVGTTQLVIKM